MPTISSVESCAAAMLEKIRSCFKNIPHDRIILSSPYHQHTDDYTVGVCMYDILDFCPSQTSAPVYRPAGEKSFLRSLPPKLIELRFMLYTNENAKFGAYLIETEHKIFTKLIDAVYTEPYLGEEREIPLSFAFLTTGEKSSLWQGFSQPMQTAIYLNAGPVPVEGSMSEIIPAAENWDLYSGAL